DQVIVGRLHVEVVVPHAETAIADVGAALGLPEVVPEGAPVACVDRPGVVGSGEKECAIDGQHGGADVDAAAETAAATTGIAGALAADDGGRRATAAASAEAPEAAGGGRARGEPRSPREGEVLDVGLVDLR